LGATTGSDDTFDLIALGETMVSIVADGPIASATGFVATHGGAESNVCVGLARLGRRAAWVGRLGTDGFGDLVANGLAAAGVDLRFVHRDPDRPTGLMLRSTDGTVRYDRAGSAASGMSPHDLDGVPVGAARAVFVSGITALIGDEPGRAAVALLEGAGGLRVVDPNLRPGLVGSDRAAELVMPLVARADVMIGGEAELRCLVGNLDGRALAGACRALGPAEVVVKRGPAGAAVLDGEGRWHEHVPEPGPDVDPVGAGDAFTAGYLDARLAGLPVDEALRRGARCGAEVAATLGDTVASPRPGVANEATTGAGPTPRTEGAAPRAR
jgi:2-dehydro-3-deoxygluconokinase